MFGEDPSSPPVPVRGPGGSGLFDSEILISGRMALVAVESKITEITARFTELPAAGKKVWLERQYSRDRSDFTVQEVLPRTRLVVVCYQRHRWERNHLEAWVKARNQEGRSAEVSPSGRFRKASCVYRYSDCSEQTQATVGVGQHKTPVFELQRLGLDQPGTCITRAQSPEALVNINVWKRNLHCHVFFTKRKKMRCPVEKTFG